MTSHVVALCGGVGGAKLAFGLAAALPSEALTIVVNTGDDFIHLGLHVSPDIDTVVYTLAGLADAQRGWGLAGETWAFMASLRRLGGETWFQLGDQDLAMHVERTRRLAAGESLSQVTAALTAALGVRHAVIPMSDDPVRTMIATVDGELEFQRYFVGEQCRPVATGIRFEGASAASRSPGVREVLARADLEAVIICPSNPYLSVDPILAVPGVRSALERTGVPIVAVSPIVGGQALKGPAAKLMRERGLEPGVKALVDHYGGLLSGLVVDEADAEAARELRSTGLPVQVTRTIMTANEDRVRLAAETLDFARSLRGGARRAAS